MRKIISSLALCLLAMAAACSTLLAAGPGGLTPDWVLSYHSGGMELADAFVGVGSLPISGQEPTRDEHRAARDVAIQDLCFKLSVTVESELRQVVSEADDASSTNVTSSLMVATRQTFSGLDERSSWTDVQKREHWVLVSIDKARALEQLREDGFLRKVKEYMRAESDELKQGQQMLLAAIRRSQEAQAAQVEQMERLRTHLDGKIEHAGNETRAQYAELAEQIAQLTAMVGRMQASQGDMGRIMAVSREIDGGLTRVNGAIGQDYTLALMRDDLANDGGRLEVSIDPDKGDGGEYREGEPISFLVRANRDCYIKVLYLTAGQVGQVAMLLFPNIHSRDNFIRAGQVVRVPDNDSLIISPPFGRDTITVVAQEAQFSNLEEEMRQALAGPEALASADMAVQLRSAGSVRGISVQAFSALENEVAAASDTCFITTRRR